MSNDSWDERRRAQEDAFFDKQNKAALETLARRKANDPRKSPITGKPMQQRVIDGVTVDVCLDSGGVWLDAGELEQLLQHATQSASGNTQSSSWLTNFWSGLKGR